jgi:hypothetical protein
MTEALEAIRQVTVSLPGTGPVFQRQVRPSVWVEARGLLLAPTAGIEATA